MRVRVRACVCARVCVCLRRARVVAGADHPGGQAPHHRPGPQRPPHHRRYAALRARALVEAERRERKSLRGAAATAGAAGTTAAAAAETAAAAAAASTSRLLLLVRSSIGDCSGSGDGGQRTVSGGDRPVRGRRFLAPGDFLLRSRPRASAALAIARGYEYYRQVDRLGSR